MPKNMCGRWLTLSLAAGQQRERSGLARRARCSNRGRVQLSFPRSRRCRPLHRKQGKPAVVPSGPWTTLPPTRSRMRYPVFRAEADAPGQRRGFSRLQNHCQHPCQTRLPCAGRLRASMLSCLCAPPFSTVTTTRSGSKNMLPDCLQLIYTPACLF